MLPTLASKGDVLLVNKLAKTAHAKPARDDVYIFVSPDDPTKLICKRIKALVR